MDSFLNRFAAFIDVLLEKIRFRAMKHRLTFYPNIDDSVTMGSGVRLIGPRDAFIIGEGTYVNEAIITTGVHSKVIIGKYCAIGYRVSIKAITHDINNPCPDEQGNIRTFESDITIGDFCWIGDNVFIREGVSLGDHVIVGANSVVTKSFPSNVTIAGIPAKIISSESNCSKD